MMIEGLASPFLIADTSGDRVRPGAFAQSLSTRPRPALLLGHQPRAVIGKWLALQETAQGLTVRGWINPDHPLGKRAISSIEDGELSGLSIGFRPVMWRARAGPGRDLKRIDLVEISLVERPMAPTARFAPVATKTTANAA